MKESKHRIDTLKGNCDECGSGFILQASKMKNLCPECSHWLYAHPACDHEFKEGRCSECGWNGNSTAYIEKLKRKAGESS